MRGLTTAIPIVIVGCLTTIEPSRATAQSASRPLIGEVRMLVIDPANDQLLAELRCAGWTEAKGQVFLGDEHPQLAEAIGRAWTHRDRSLSEFALPDLSGRPADENDGADGVLSGADNVTGGRVLPRNPKPTLQYWIYTGTAGVHRSLASKDTESCGRDAARRRERQ